MENPFFNALLFLTLTFSACGKHDNNEAPPEPTNTELL